MSDIPIDSSRFQARPGRSGPPHLVLALLAAAFVLSAAGVRAGQGSPAGAPPPGLVIAGDVARPETLTAADLKAMPRTTVSVQDSGRTVVYEGVLVAHVLGRAGVPLGRELSGNALTTYVRASASDGYEVVFSVAELDPAMTSNDVIIADTVDGKPLFDFQGPLRIVAPRDARAARSVRMLVRLDVTRLRK